MVVFKTIVMLDLFSRYKTVGVEIWRERRAKRKIIIQSVGSHLMHTSFQLSSRLFFPPAKGKPLISCSPQLLCLEPGHWKLQIRVFVAIYGSSVAVHLWPVCSGKRCPGLSCLVWEWSLHLTCCPRPVLAVAGRALSDGGSNQVVFYFFEDLDLPHRLLATVYRCIVKGRLQ